MKDQWIRGGGLCNGLGEGKVKSIDDNRVRDNGGHMIVRRYINIIFVRKSVCRAHLRTWGDNPFNVEVLEKERSASLTMREFVRILDV